jgi:hypothetical protein
MTVLPKAGSKLLIHTRLKTLSQKMANAMFTEMLDDDGAFPKVEAIRHRNSSSGPLAETF